MKASHAYCRTYILPMYYASTTSNMTASENIIIERILLKTLNNIVTSLHSEKVKNIESKYGFVYIPFDFD